MPRGFLSVRIDAANERHHLWLNNGTWWVHYTLNFDFRTRRVRRSLETAALAEAIRRRDTLFQRLTTEGEWVPERGEEGEMPSLLRLCAAAGPGSDHGTIDLRKPITAITPIDCVDGGRGRPVEGTPRGGRQRCC